MDIFAGTYIRTYIGTNLPAATATDFKEIPELASFVAGSIESTVIDVPVYNQNFNRKLLGSQQIPNIDLQVNILPDNETHQLLKEYAKNKKRCQLKIEIFEDSTMTTGYYEIYRAFISTSSTEGSKDEVVKTTFTFAVDGGPVDEGLLPKDGE
ncbi:TPA: hypothetical protein JG946_003759 [Enterobacter hormaechei subsp. steigerwaltii]|nr:hypothetical protein [Enterobacter hormaechei subsp. steigerwaltii]